MNHLVLIVRHATSLSCLMLMLASAMASAALAHDALRQAAPGRVVSVHDVDGRTRSLVLEPDGDHAVLRLDAAQIVLPVSSEQVLTFGSVSASADAVLRRNPSAAVELSGEHRHAGFIPDSFAVLEGVVEAISPVDPEELRFRPLLPLLHASTYGEESRSHVEVTSSRRLHLVCEPGHQAAGVLLAATLAGLPATAGSDLRMRVRGQGHVDIAISDPELLQAESPHAIGAVLAGVEWTPVVLALPPLGWSAGRWQAISLACPEAAADLEFEALEVGLSDAEPSPQLRAFWVWDAREWRDDPSALLARLGHASAREVFISVPLQDERCVDPDCAVADPAALARFLAAAQSTGIRVWVVTGDPMAVLPEERPAWVGRVHAYAAFNRTLPAGAGFAGIQYDIEPYLLPGFGQAPEAWLARYDELLQALHAAAPELAMDVVIPWWFGRPGTPTAGLLDRLAAYAARLTVMDYRTDREQVIRAALPFLAWARSTGRDVRIALEAGPLPDQESHHYVPAAEGPLWVLRLGEQAVYVLCDRVQAHPPGALSYADRGAHLIPASRTTFHSHLDDLWRAVSRLESDLASTRAFAGAAIHGLEPAWY